MTARTFSSTSESDRTPEALKSRPVVGKGGGIAVVSEYCGSSIRKESACVQKSRKSRGRRPAGHTLAYREAPEADGFEAPRDPEIHTWSPSPCRQKRASQTRAPAGHARTWVWRRARERIVTGRGKEGPPCSRGVMGGRRRHPPKEPRMECATRMGGRGRVVQAKGHRWLVPKVGIIQSSAL